MVLLPALAIAIIALVLVSLRLAGDPLSADSPISDRADRLWRRSLLISAIAVAVLGNVPLIGLPGFGWLALASPVVDEMTNWPMGRFEANASWPSAMMITALWPACFLPCWWLVRRARSRSGLVVTSLGAVLLATVWGFVLALAMIVLYFVW